MDDAVHQTIENENIVELGVHIAGMLLLCTEESALDKEALIKTYVTDRVVPMLPGVSFKTVLFS